MSNKNSNRGFGGKGYYIALILCAAAIGISGYVYYNSTSEADTLQQPGTPVIATDTVGSTKPTQPEATSPATKPTTPATQPTKPSAGKLSTCSPVDGEILAEYAMEVLSYNQTTRDWRVHNGVDIAAQAGTDVAAAADGQVYTVFNDEEMGMTVVIRHENGYTTTYSSLSESVSVAAGDSVKMGQTIGTVGSTALMENALGDHVHFSVSCNDEIVDPQEFLGQ